MSKNFWIDTMRDKMTGKLDKCPHGRYGYEACEECATTQVTHEIRSAVIHECAAVIGRMRQSEAGMFDPKHSGQRGCDRLDALYEAYQAVMALALSDQPTPNHTARD